jgi:hypothetical protein
MCYGMSMCVSVCALVSAYVLVSVCVRLQVLSEEAEQGKGMEWKKANERAVKSIR